MADLDGLATVAELDGLATVTTTRLLTTVSDILLKASLNAFVFARLTSASAAASGRLNPMQLMFTSLKATMLILRGEIFSICSRRPSDPSLRGSRSRRVASGRGYSKGTAELLRTATVRGPGGSRGRYSPTTSQAEARIAFTTGSHSARTESNQDVLVYISPHLSAQRSLAETPATCRAPVVSALNARERKHFLGGSVPRGDSSGLSSRVAPAASSPVGGSPSAGGAPPSPPHARRLPPNIGALHLVDRGNANFVTTSLRREGARASEAPPVPCFGSQLNHVAIELQEVPEGERVGIGDVVPSGAHS